MYFGRLTTALLEFTNNAMGIWEDVPLGLLKAPLGGIIWAKVLKNLRQNAMELPCEGDF